MRLSLGAGGKLAARRSVLTSVSSLGARKLFDYRTRKMMSDNKKINKFKSVLGTVVGVVSGFLSILGLINVLDDLASWGRFGKLLIEKAELIGLEGVVSFSLLVIHSVSVYWRDFLYPVFDFFTAWLPFKFPSLLKDFVIIALFVWLGKKRAFRVFSRSLKGEQRLMSNIVYKYLVAGNERFLYFSPSDAKNYILMRDADKSILESHEVSNIEKINRCFGENAEAFSYDVLTNPELQSFRKRHMDALKLSDRLKFLVYVLAFFVGLFLLLDYIYLLQQAAGQ